MHSIDLPSGKFYYQFDGPPDAPVLILSNSLGTDHTMWDLQIPTLERYFRVLRYDSRGHGASAVPFGPYTIEMLGQDALALCDALSISRAHFCGLSMGGMVGMWLAAHVPERIDRLALCNTAARMGPPQLWDARIGSVRQWGMANIIAAVIVRWFTPAFFEREPEIVETMRQILLRTPAEGYIACCEAIRDMDLRAALPRIRARTLVIAGSLDAASPPADGRYLAEAIPDARYQEFLAAHMANVEVGQPFTDALVRFFRGAEA
jgi:3-oxoadipate enol-lactonase